MSNKYVKVEILKKDPERYQKHLEKMKRRRERISRDPERSQKVKKRERERYHKKMEAIKSNPIQYQEYLESWKKRANKYYNEVTKKKPEKLKAILKSQMERYNKHKDTSAFKEALKRYYNNISPQVKAKRSKRIRDRAFKRLCKYSNRQYLDNKLNPFDLWKVAKKQKLKCVFTGQPLTVHNMSVDHIIPKSKGGPNIPSNIRLVLKPVNIAKSTMSDTEFLELCKSITNYANKKNSAPDLLQI